MEGGVGPTTTTTSNSHSRPVRASRFYNNVHSSSAINHHNSSTFTGPVRKWEKKWVHVSSSKPSTTKQKKQSNGGGGPNTSSKSPILLCKWTPLSTTTIAGDDDGDNNNSVEIPKRKFRYTPIAVYEEQKKLAVKRAAESNESGESHQSAKRVAMDADDIYGMLDMNHDLMGADQEPSKSFTGPHSSSRSHFNLGLFSENQNQERQLDAVEVSGF